MTSPNGIHPAVRVGHVHLHVSDLDRALAFYRDGLGFNLTGDGRAMGLPMAFVAAGDYHHHVGLNTFKPSGLYHVAFNYPDRRELARAVRRLQDHGGHCLWLRNHDQVRPLDLYYLRARALRHRTDDICAGGLVSHTLSVSG